MFNKSLPLVILLSIIFLSSCSEGGGDNSNSDDSNDDVNSNNEGDSSLVLSSTAFKDAGSTYFNLPISYTCDGVGGGVSPQLSWSGVSSDATSLVITMNTEDSNGIVTPQFTLFNIPTSVTTLAEDDFSIGTVATGDGASYAAPCGDNGSTTLYTFTIYALTADLSLTTSATQEDVINAAQDVLVESTTLLSQRIRYDGTDLNDDSHVPTSVASTCADKIADFDQISSVIKEVDCDDANNQMDVISYISDGLKTTESEQQVQVGIKSWIGRLSIPSETGHSVKVAPSYYDKANNNFACDGVDTLGITIDGQIILPYYKQSNSGGSGSTCGPTDGFDYADRDTVVLGEVDQCYGHAPNGEGYHMHGAPVCLMDVLDPSKPIAYMSDGIPLYFGEGGGTITNTTHGISAAASGKAVTDINYGSGLYEHLNYLPSDVNNGSNPLNDCNAYDINGDGATSGYVYYTTKDAPYTIGCYMGEPLTGAGNPGAKNTKFTSFLTQDGAEDDREGWLGQILGEAMEGEVVSNTYDTFNNKTYNVTEFEVTDTTLSFLTAGDTAQVLWRVLDETDSDYDSSTTCFEFRYRKDSNITNSDETETICSEESVPSTTLDFTPFD